MQKFGFHHPALFHAGMNITVIGEDQPMEFLAEAPENKVEILNYLNSGYDSGLGLLLLHKDIFDGWFTGFDILFDAKYFWSNEDIHYFDKYNLKISNDFLQHIKINNFKNPKLNLWQKDKIRLSLRKLAPFAGGPLQVD